MKLEKREITLNEYDSISDILFTEKNLLFAYAHAVEEITRKQTLHTLSDFMQKTYEDLYFVKGLLNGSSIESK